MRKSSDGGRPLGEPVDRRTTSAAPTNHVPGSLGSVAASRPGAVPVGYDQREKPAEVGLSSEPSSERA